MTEPVDIRDAVRERYSKSASTSSSGCCGDGASSCCSEDSRAFGYTAVELESLPEGADLALGCGNPTAIAGLRAGETVLDLGSGGGIDCFLASRRVGPSGSVIGVDMTPAMISRAREAALRGEYANVEFRLGEIENIPAADQSVDVIISNCVINLSPDKGRVFSEAFRVLRPAGRLIVSDIVLSRTLSPEVRKNVTLLTGCIAGAMPRDEYLEAIRRAGFKTVEVQKETQYAKQAHLETLAADAGISSEETREVASAALSVIVVASR